MDVLVHREQTTPIPSVHTDFAVLGDDVDEGLGGDVEVDGGVEEEVALGGDLVERGEFAQDEVSVGRLHLARPV